jgi:NF-X1-type zinc finger protein NFXL1
VAWFETKSLGVRTCNLCQPAPAGADAHVSVTWSVPAPVKVNEADGLLMPSLRSQRKLTLPAPFAVMFAEKLNVPGHAPVNVVGVAPATTPVTWNGTGVGVLVGIGVKVGVLVGIGVRVGVLVGIGVKVGVLVGIGVKVGVLVGIGVLVGVGVLVNVAVGNGVAVGPVSVRVSSLLL